MEFRVQFEDTNIFIALVSFYRGEDLFDMLPDGAGGACGWMGIKAKSDENVRFALDKELKEIGLELFDVEEVTEVVTSEEVKMYDEHLALNMEDWNDKTTCWGTLHCFDNHD